MGMTQRSTSSMTRTQALKKLYDAGAHLFVFHVERDPEDPTKKKYFMGPAWQAGRDSLDAVLSAAHVGIIAGSIRVIVCDVDVKDGRNSPDRQRLGNERIQQVLAWAGETACIVRTPTNGAHLFYREDAKRGKRIVKGVLAKGKLEVFGHTGFVELYDPVRLAMMLDGLPVFAGALGEADDQQPPDDAPAGKRVDTARRGQQRGDRHNGYLARMVAALKGDADPKLAIADALKDARDAGLPEDELGKLTHWISVNVPGMESVKQRATAEEALSEIGAIVRRYEEEDKDVSLTRENMLAVQSQGRLEALLRGDELDPVYRMREMVNAWQKGGDEAVRGIWLDRVKQGLAEGLDWSAPDEPAWLVPGWLPEHRLAFLFAPGGMGKTRLGVQLAVALAVGALEWIPGVLRNKPVGLEPVRRKVLVLTWEDPARSMKRIVTNAAKVIGIQKADVQASVAGYLDVQYAGKLGPLWAPADTGSGHISTIATLTAAGRWVIEQMADYDLVVLDPLAAVFASEENTRALVRPFITTFDQAALERKCSVLVLGHGSKSSKVSGSTDWTNGVRCVLAMSEVERKVPQVAGGKRVKQEVKSGIRLEALKMNEAPLPEPVWLVSHGGGWHAGNPP